MKVTENKSISPKYIQFLTRFVFAIVLIAVSTMGMQAQRIYNPANKAKRGTVAEQIATAPINNNSMVDQLLKVAFSYRGTPYVRGAMSPRGFDCSGFTSYVFAKFGFKLNRSSRDQIRDGRKVSRNELKPGDLVFFNGRGRGPGIGHVGIVTEANNNNGTFKFIHAASRGVTESHSTESYYRVRYVNACRVIE